jgi:hypothetical protein
VTEKRRAGSASRTAAAEEEVGRAAPACSLSSKGREAGGCASPRCRHGAVAEPRRCRPLAPTAGGVLKAHVAVDPEAAAARSADTPAPCLDSLRFGTQLASELHHGSTVQGGHGG